MKKNFLFFLLFFSSLFAETPTYIIATQPKGGTGLLTKLLLMLGGEKPTKFFWHLDPNNYSPQMLDNFIKEGGMPILHLFRPQYTYDYLKNNHLDSKVIIIIRDIRDAFVSYAYFAYYYLNIPIQKKISLVFKDELYCEMSSHLSLFLNDERFLVIRFEDLIGPKGGGSPEKQIEIIRQIGDYIGRPITKREAEYYAERLFGNDTGPFSAFSITFRTGKIGAWEDHFTEKHKKKFKEQFNAELIRLKYVKDENW